MTSDVSNDVRLYLKTPILRSKIRLQSNFFFVKKSIFFSIKKLIKKSATLITLTKVILIIDNILDMGITGWHDGV